VDNRTPLLAFQASFMITPDPADPNPSFTSIIGTKRLITPEGTGSNCADGFIFNFGILGAPFSPLATYDATIKTPTGTYKDSGGSQVQFTDAFPGASVGDDFVEQFMGGSCVPVPVPTTTNDCIHGGWQTFADFKNEGDCVSFVATNGKNPPAGT
jgi:hypothetical protein